ncbi:MAG: adenosylcobinamide-GDP ribazoletransferase [Verrucomicrobiales bacterium]|jgi:adenosylcobinamide-GDP ribazoletransferase
MLRPFHGLWVAAGFLTRIPVGDVSRAGRIEVDVAKAVPWFPVVGLAIGAAVGGVYAVSLEFFAPLVSASLALAATMLITGAFHHDGLADVADAFGGGWTIEERMAIMKDSRLGTYGTTALALALILEVAAVAQLDARDGFFALVVAHSLARSMAVAAMILSPATGNGMGATYVERLSPIGATFAILVGVASAARFSPTFPLITIGAAAVAAIAVVALAVRKIGGLTGDVLGAVVVLSTLAILITS